MRHPDTIWNQLQLCIVGRCWQPDAFNGILCKDTQSRLQLIAQETNEDLDRLAAVLQVLGVQVLRPELDASVDLDFAPPMCAGDYMLSMGRTVYESLTKSCNLARRRHQRFYSKILHDLGQDFDIQYTGNLAACQAMSLVLDDRLIYSKCSGQSSHDARSWWQQRSTVPIYQFYDDSHLDGWFCVPTNGLLLSGTDQVRPAVLHTARRTLFPEYRIVECDINQSQSHSFVGWMSQQQHQSWAVPAAAWSYKLQHFVDGYLSAWVGNAQETVFEINSVVVDQQNILMTHCSDTTYQALAQNGVRPHMVPWRHGLFWDAGINCATFAIHRKE